MRKIEAKEYPITLKNINNPPKQLYCEGNIELLKSLSVAVIGSRVCTDYGKEQAKIFVKELVKNNICIVSGMAKGIDSVSHQTAIKEGGKTIAVLGSGFLHIYPEENINLYHTILQTGGLVITEYEPNIRPENKNFPERNRIVSGLSQAVLVVEAVHRSGTTITAQIAKKQGKKVYCIPRNLGEKNGVGTNRLIQKGAFLTTSPIEILKDLNKISLHTQLNIEDLQENKEEIPIQKEYKEIYQYLTTLPETLDIIAKRANKNVSTISAILTLMEMDGIIQKFPGGRFCRKN